jgi:Rieske Fe-S protein
VSVQPLTRRSLLSGAGVAVVGAVLGFVVARNSNAAEPAAAGTAANAYGTSNGGGGKAVLASVSAVTGSGIVEKGVVLTRDSSGGVHGVSAVCTHEGCTVGTPENGVTTCPCHGSQFEAATGKVLRGPATQPLPAVAVRVEGNDVVRG